MRVGIDARGLGNINRWRGIGRYTARLVEALVRNAERDMEFVLFGYGDGPNRDLLDAGTARCAEWVSVPLLGKYSYPGMVAEHLLFARRVAASGVEVFHGIDHNLSPFLPCPSLVTVHDLVLLVLRGPYLGPTAWAWMRFHRAAARRARFVVAVSENTARDVERIWGIPRGRIAVVPEGVTPEYRPPGDRGTVERTLSRYGIRQPYFLYLGGFDPRKNLRNLLLGFKRFLFSTSEDVLLVMAGDRHGFEGYLDDEVEELGLEGRVLFTDFVPEEDLPALYGGATLFVCVSLYEGFGLPLLEAMACGTPVLASHVSSIPEVVGEAGILVDPLDPEEIAAGMRKLWEEADLRAELATRGRERAASFTWDAAARRILDLYRQARS
ncbi:glycosyltransferase family 4 protein [Candidatus Solincola sp.]|nr:glycosyltransferase family 1 protein [Actinomycetota bacterium]MDI7251506.1 glycosyltransferase family 1 protein [Actinomycetota bacterium]